MKKGWLLYDERDYEQNRLFATHMRRKAEPLKLSLSVVFTDNFEKAVFAPPDFVISRQRNPLLSQRLERMGIPVFNNARICELCKVEYDPAPEYLSQYFTWRAGYRLPPLYRGEGCEHCHRTGYHGRVGIYELFVITDDARSLILAKRPTGEIRRHAIERGMVTLRDDGWAKARAGITTVEEILRVTQEDT